MKQVVNKQSKVMKTNFKNIENRLLLIYVAMVLSVAVLLSIAFLRKSSTAIQNNAMNLIAANTSQIELNINSYLEKVERTAALLFSDENYYKYDETSGKYDDYTKIQYENAISAKIVDLGIMENFSDFGIVYADDYTVGWISNTTKELFESGEMYSSLVSGITNEKTENGWFFGVNENYDRLFYVKRLNENAVILASIYSRELASVFTIPKELTGMKIGLINDDNQILYSSKKDDIGNYISDGTAMLIGKEKKITINNGENIINIDSCKNGWRIISMISADYILRDLSELRYFTITVTIVLTAVFVIAGVLLFSRSTKPVDTIMSDLESKAESDGLSGLLNKMAYENKIKNELSHTISGCSIAFIILDVDHFKSINDSEGHAVGDAVIVRVSELLRRVLPNDIILGRIGGDEFSFMIKSVDKDVKEMSLYIEEILVELSKEFLNEFKDEHVKYDVSLSIGADVFKYNNKTESPEDNFEIIYKNADAALYVSKEGGRNRYTFYEEGMTHEE